MEAASATPHDAKDPLGLPLEDFARDLAVNTTSAFVAAQQAVLAFEKLPESASRTFICTGNCTNVKPIVALMDLGVGKSATAHIIECAAEAYKHKGYKYVRWAPVLMIYVNNWSDSTTPMKGMVMARPRTAPGMDQPTQNFTLILQRRGETHRDRGSRLLSKGSDIRSFRP